MGRPKWLGRVRGVQWGVQRSLRQSWLAVPTLESSNLWPPLLWAAQPIAHWVLRVPRGDPKKTDVRVGQEQLDTLEKFKGTWVGAGGAGGDAVRLPALPCVRCC